MSPGDVASGRGEQVRCAVRPAVERPAVCWARMSVSSSSSMGTAASRFILCVEVAQVGGALAVVEQAVERQRAGVGDPQPAPDEDQRDQLALRVGPPVEVGRCFDLGHDVLGDRRSIWRAMGWQCHR